MENHPAIRKVQRLEEIDRVYHWLTDNAESLVHAVRMYDDKELGFRLLAMSLIKQFRSDHSYDVGRLLHNYVASAITVRDHFQKFVAAEDEDFKREFVAYGRSFSTIPVVAFTEGLRNFLLHQRVMNFVFRYQLLSDGGSIFQTFLRADQLLGMNAEWNRHARAYIHANAPRIEIGALVEEFLGQLAPFDAWVKARAHNAYFPAFQSFERDAAELRRLKEILGAYVPPLASGGLASFMPPPPVVPPDLSQADEAVNHF